MKSCFHLSITIILFFTACKKHQANPYDVMNNTAAENALLLEGNWIEDSLHISYDGTYTASPGSFLNIDSNLNYSLYQGLQGTSVSDSISGTISFQGSFSIKFNVGPNSGSFTGLYQMAVATNHQLVLGQIDGPFFGLSTYYYHK
jgi:hypothetical protein